MARFVAARWASLRTRLGSLAGGALVALACFAGTPRVEVTLEVTRDLGCVRGFNETRIGPINDPHVLELLQGSYEVVDAAAPPWSAAWWCK